MGDEDEIQSTSRSFAETLAEDSPSVESAANEISGMMKSALKIIDGEKEEEEDEVEILSEENEMKNKKETNIGVRQAWGTTTMTAPQDLFQKGDKRQETFKPLIQVVDGKSDGSLLDLETQSGTKQMEKNATTMTPSKWAQPSEKKPSRLIEEITAEPAAEGDGARRPLIEDITAEPRRIMSSKQQVCWISVAGGGIKEIPMEQAGKDDDDQVNCLKISADEEKKDQDVERESGLSSGEERSSFLIGEQKRSLLKSGEEEQSLHLLRGLSQMEATGFSRKGVIEIGAGDVKEPFQSYDDDNKDDDDRVGKGKLLVEELDDDDDDEVGKDEDCTKRDTASPPGAECLRPGGLIDFNLKTFGFE